MLFYSRSYAAWPLVIASEICAESPHARGRPVSLFLKLESIAEASLAWLISHLHTKRAL